MFRTRRRQLEPHSDAESFHVCPEDVYVEIDHDLRHEDESFHTAYLDFQGAQDVLRQVRVARWFLSCCDPSLDITCCLSRGVLELLRKATPRELETCEW